MYKKIYSRGLDNPSTINRIIFEVEVTQPRQTLSITLWGGGDENEIGIGEIIKPQQQQVYIWN